MASYEVLTESVQDYFFEESEAMMEGVNTDMTKKLREIQKQFNEIMKQAKADYKKKDYKAAMEGCDNLIKKIDEYSAEIQNIEETAGSIITGYFYQGLCSSIKACLIGLVTFGVGSTFSVFKDAVDQVVGIMEQWKKDGDAITPKMLNLRRLKVNGLLKNMKTGVSNLKKKIEAEMKDSEKEDSVKESVDNVKLSIYESCRSGEITEEERDLLLEMM